MNLGDLTCGELKALLKEMGESAFRGEQLFRWIHKGAESFDEMTNISKKLSARLDEKGSIFLPRIYKKLVSEIDGTVKYLMELEDSNLIECVVMEYHHGRSICVSSQVGCRMGCSFCASTLGGLVRNLTPFEIEGQLLRAEKDLNVKISNIVIMGIGEPLDNYDNIIKFIRNINDEKGVGMGLRHITLSTCGLVDKMKRLADEKLPINLAVSLHAPTDEKRKALMPVSNAWPLKELMAACDYYFSETGRRITFEYALVKGKNAGEKEARELAGLLGKRNCHVNLIPVNPVTERSNVRTSALETEKFCKELTRLGINATVRRELGADINASCGQLRNGELSESGR